MAGPAAMPSTTHRRSAICWVLRADRPEDALRPGAGSDAAPARTETCVAQAPAANRLALALGLFALLLVSACGGGSSATASPPPAPQPPADAVCPAPTRSLESVAVGYNVNVLFWEGLFNDRALLDAVAMLGAPVLRYPGGTESDYHHWLNGRPVEPCRYSTCRTWDNRVLQPPALYQGFGSFTQGTPVFFASLLSAVRGAPLLVANMVTASPDETLSWLTASRAAGVAVARVELGNEPYFAQVEGTANNATVFPDAESHVGAARALAQQVRTAFPAARLAQPAFAPRIDLATGQLDPGNDTRMRTWNERIVAAGAADHADAFALHFYPRLPGRAGRADAAYLADIGTAAARYWRATRATPQWAVLPPAKSLWITEFNVSFADAAELVGTWMHGLFLAQFALRALEDARVELLIAHMLTGNRQWQTVVHPGRAPDVVPAPGFESYALTAQGRALAAVAATLAGGRCGRALAQSELSGVTDTDRVAAWLLTRGTVERMVIVNADAATARIDLSSAGWQAAAGRVLTAAPLARITGPAALSDVPAVAAQGRVEVPPYALAWFERTR